nr:PhnD/SsuA/transferrin family substrate-binding protein [uncultured Holophaga sp.]
MQIARTCLLLLCLVSAGTARVWSSDPHWVRIGFSQASFPEVSPQDVRASLSIWAEEVTRSVPGISGVSTYIFGRPGEIAEALRRSEIDVVVMPTYDYLSSMRSTPVDIGFVTDQGPVGCQRFVIVGDARMPSPTLSSLRGRRFCHVDGENLALLFVNNELLRTSQMEMDRFFRGIEVVPRGVQALNGVYFGKADVCVVSEDTFRLATTMNPQMAHRLRIIASSPLLYNGVALFRQGFPEPMRRAVLDGIAGLGSTSRGRQILSLFRACGIRPATEADLAVTRRLYQEYRRRKGRLL